jgi:thiamine transport system ATP-binding protein
MLWLDRVGVAFGGRAALADVELTVDEREIVSVLGPSGSGKSTLLRVVAGLQTPDTGRVLLAGVDQSGVAAHRRGVGLMFQDHALFPHRDVAGNVAFGLTVRGMSKPDAAARVADLLTAVGLAGAGRRAVGTLSGGEQQRVALARALAPSPKVLMLDEPLGQLDRTLRERLVGELRRLFVARGTTVLAVTHDQAEAFALADRVVVMDAGRIAQVGTPEDVWTRPASAFVARFLGFENVVATVIAGGVAETPWGPLPVPPGTPDGSCDLLVRPAGVRLDPDGPLTATVGARTFRGESVVLRLTPEHGPDLDATHRPDHAPSPGDAVRLRFDPGAIVPLPAPPAWPEQG